MVPVCILVEETVRGKNNKLLIMLACEKCYFLKKKKKNRAKSGILKLAGGGQVE